MATNGISVGNLAQADGMNRLDSNMKAGKKAQFSDSSYRSKGSGESRTIGCSHRGLDCNVLASKRDSSSSGILRRILSNGAYDCSIATLEGLRWAAVTKFVLSSVTAVS